MAAADHNDVVGNGPNDEGRIAQSLRHELLMLPYYRVFDDLAFRVNGDTGTLLGEVTDPVLKSDTQNVVKKVEGVTSVNNQIEVLPLSDLDWQIRRAVAISPFGVSRCPLTETFPGLGSPEGGASISHLQISCTYSRCYDLCVYYRSRSATDCV